MEAAIRGYLQLHARAVDTERGICEWWVRDLDPPASTEEVRTAIANLVADGALVPFTLPDGELAYQAPGWAAPPTAGPH